ncbi:MAG: sulfite exporter TauE/SafE family protein [Deltaproteobacteria bacterium]|nr:sulfite exporter TauE/SafE family protein [Deltaproteobacteria bacterium]MBW2064822.1 sulfite exporter TauE/SafE family protein [Deltaproteobacteria bacterium]
MQKEGKIHGWEIAREVEREKATIAERLRPGKRQIVAIIWGLVAFGVIFLIGCWLAGNPFDATQRIPSAYVRAKGWVGTNEWGIIWPVVGLALFFEFMDASAGMGYGTALTPLLLVLGFDPKQIVPAVMIQQASAGLVGAFLHREFENVEWKLRPIMSETMKLYFLIAIIGCAAVTFSITAVYAYFKVAKVWIKLYVACLLLVMGAVSLWQGRIERPYHPKRMLFWGALAGFNKGVGGGGYGPVVTVGGLLSGVPVKSMLAVTAISEGTVSCFSIIVWLSLLAGGVTIDYLLLPSMMLPTMFTAVAAPYTTRVFPEKMWRIVVPFYCVIVAIICFCKIIPSVIAKLAG